MRFEGDVFSALRRLRAGRTTIVIAHACPRPATPIEPGAGAVRPRRQAEELLSRAALPAMCALPLGGKRSTRPKRWTTEFMRLDGSVLLELAAEERL